MGKKNRQGPPAIADAPVKDAPVPRPVSGNKIFLFGLPIAGFVILCSLWFGVYKPTVSDEWYRGVMLVDSSNKTADQAAKKHLLETGGQILQKQVQLHPYHARVWLLYGYYFLMSGKWDSSIYAHKKAIELGAGGVVNGVEYTASERLNYSLERKLYDINDLGSSLQIIENATTKNFQNKGIDKLKGFAFYKFGQMDSCNFYLERFNKNSPNDFPALSVLAFNYSRMGNRDKALFYATEARKIKNDDAGINNLINQLNAQ